jgi:protein phosphatase
MTKKTQTITVEYGHRSDRGRMRAENQDNYGKFPADAFDLARPNGLLFIVADGMGGHERGREASALAVSMVQQTYFSDPSPSIPEKLRKSVQVANSHIHERGDGGSAERRMGTTCTALVLAQKRAFIAHVGDSRAYRIRGKKIEQLTRDHTKAAEMYRHGVLSQSEMRVHPERSVLHRVLGMESDVEVDLVENISVRDGDVFLLCTDGLAEVSEEEILWVAQSNSPSRTCDQLVALANERGGRDNVTVLAIRIRRETRSSASARSRWKFWKPWVKVLATGALVGAAALALAVGLRFRGHLQRMMDGWSPRVSRPASPPPSMIVGSPDETSPRIDSRGDDLVEAAAFLRRGQPDSALDRYRRVLASDPTHLGAIEGVNQVAESYLQQAENSQRRGDIHGALVLYQKASNLRPQDLQIQHLVERCRRQLRRVTSEFGVKKGGKTSTLRMPPQRRYRTNPPGARGRSGQDSSSLGGARWELPRLGSEDYVTSTNSLRFRDTGRPKLALYQGSPMADPEVEVHAELLYGDVRGRYGLVVGHQWTDRADAPSYYLFSVDGRGSYALNRIFPDGQELIFTASGKVATFEEADSLRLRVRCLGPWIMVYANDALLNAWQGPELIQGRVGLYADAGLEVIFSGFKVGSALNRRKESDR